MRARNSPQHSGGWWEGRKVEGRKEREGKRGKLVGEERKRERERERETEKEGRMRKFRTKLLLLWSIHSLTLEEMPAGNPQTRTY
jgi:hypothetical protein